MKLHSSVSHILVTLAALILLVMPWTEQHWTFDDFLHGGPDLELSLLAVVTMLCLVLLLASIAKHCVSILLATRRWVCRAFDRYSLTATPAHGGFAHADFSRFAIPPALHRYSSPLQI